MKFSKFILAVAASFLILSQAGAATIVGNLMDIYGGGIDRTIKISPKSTPQAVIYNGTNYTVMDLAKTVSSTNSIFAVVLLGGIYNVDFGTVNGMATPVTKILVPPYDTNTYSFNYVANLATNLGTFVWTNSYGIAAGTNIVITTNGALLVINASAPAAAVPTNFSSITVTNDINRGDASDTGKSLNISLGGSAAISPGIGGDGGTVNIASGVNGNGLAGLGGNGGTVTIAQGGTSGLNAVSGGNGGTVNIANASPKGTAGTVNIATNGSTYVGNFTVKSNAIVNGIIANDSGDLNISQNLGGNTGRNINIQADDSLDSSAGGVAILGGNASDSNGGGILIKAGNGTSIGGDVTISAGTNSTEPNTANSISLKSYSAGYGISGQIDIAGKTIFSSNVYFGSNLYVTNHAYDASGNLLDPEANEYVTASYVASLLTSGQFLYGSTNAILAGITNSYDSVTNNALLQFLGTNPAGAIKSFTFNADTGKNFVSIATTNTYQSCSGPFVTTVYCTVDSGGNKSLSIAPDIYATYDRTNLILLATGSGQSITVGTTLTNLYSWATASPTYNSTNTAGFYIVRRLRVVSVSGGPTLTISSGGNTPTALSFTVPIATSANYSGTFTGNGSGLTNILLSGLQVLPLTNNPSALLWTNKNGIYGNGIGLTNIASTNLIGLGTAAYSNATAFASSGVTNLTAGQLVTIAAAVTNNASPTFTGLTVGAQTALDVNGNGKLGGVGLTNGVITGNGSGITNVSATVSYSNITNAYGAFAPMIQTNFSVQGATATFDTIAQPTAGTVVCYVTNATPRSFQVLVNYSGTIVTVTNIFKLNYNTIFPTPPNPTWVGANPAGVAVNSYRTYFASLTTTNFVFALSGNTLSSPNTSYIWNFQVVY